MGRTTWARRIAIIIVIGMAGIFWGGVKYWATWKETSYHNQCVELRESRQWGRLETTAAEWSAWKPESGEAWMFRSEAAEGQRKLTDVVRFLGKVPQHDSRALPAYIAQARLLFDVLDRPREAIEVYQHVLRMDSRVAIAHRRTIFYYALTLQRAKMIQSIREAIVAERDPPEAYIYLFGAHWIMFGNLYEFNTRWLVNDPSNENYSVARALQVIDSRATDNSREAQRFGDVPNLDELLALYPRNLEVIASHLERAIENGDLKRVDELLRQAPDTSVADYRFWVARGWCLSAADQLAEAETAFLRALELDRFGWKARHHLADLYRNMGRLNEVTAMEESFRRGKKIRDAIIRLRDAATAPKELLEQIAVYARDCGDIQASESLFRRLRSMP